MDMPIRTGHLWDHLANDIEHNEMRVGKVEPFSLRLVVNEDGFGIDDRMHTQWEDSPFKKPTLADVDLQFAYAAYAWLAWREFEGTGTVQLTEEGSDAEARRFVIEGYALTDLAG